MSGSAALTVGIAGDISELRKAFGGAVRAASDTGRELNDRMGQANMRLVSGFKSVGESARAAFKKAGDGAGDAANRAEKAAGAFSRLSLAAGAGFAAGGLAIRSFLTAASDAEETANLVEVAFGDQSAAVKAWAKDLSVAANRSEQDMLQFAGSTQAMLAPMLGAGAATAKMSMNLVGLSNDLGSFFNAKGPAVLQALQGALVGNAEGMRRFGVVMTDATLSAYALRTGVASSLDQLTEAQKIQLRYNFIMENTRQAQGDAAKTHDSYANTMAGLEGVLKDLAVQMGTALLPAFTALADALRATLAVLRGLPPEFKTAAAWVLTAGTAFLGLVTAAGAARAVLPFLGSGFGVIAKGAAVAGGAAVAAGKMIVAALAPVIPMALAAGKALVAALVPMLPVIAAVAAAIAGIVLMIGAARTAWAGDLFGMRTEMLEWADSIRSTSRMIGAWLADIWSRAADAIGSTLTRAFDKAADVVRSIWGKLTGDLQERFGFLAEISAAIEQITVKITAAISGAWDYGASVAARIWDGGKALFADIEGDLKNAFAKGVDTLKEAFDEIAKLNPWAGKGKGKGKASGAGGAAPKPAGVLDGILDLAGAGKKANDAAAKQKREQAAAARRAAAAHQKEVEAGIQADIDALPAREAAREAARAAAEFEAALEAAAIEVESLAQEHAELADVSAALQDAARDQATAQGLANADKYWQSDEGKSALRSANASTVVAEVGDKVLQSTGAAGSMASAVAQGGMMGGPIGAAAAGIGELLMQSEAFQEMSATLSNMLANFAQCLNPFVEILEPLIDMFAEILAPVGQLISAVGSIIKALNFLNPGVWLLRAAVSAIAAGVNWVAKWISKLANGIIELVADVVEWFDWLPFVGDEVKAFADKLRKGKIDMSQFDKSVDEAGDQLKKPPEDLQDGVDKMNEALTNVPQIFKVTLARFNAAVASDAAQPTLAAGAQHMQQSNKSTVTNVQMTVRANDGASLYKSIKRQAELENFRQYGTTQIGLGGALVTRA